MEVPEEVEELEQEKKQNSDEDEGQEYTLDDIPESDVCSDYSEKKKDADEQSVSSFSSVKNPHPPVSRAQSSQQVKVTRETSFHRRQISEPAEIPESMKQVIRDQLNQFKLVISVGNL